MIWHLTKRELYDHLNSLRFAFHNGTAYRINDCQCRCDIWTRTQTRIDRRIDKRSQRL